MSNRYHGRRMSRRGRNRTPLAIGLFVIVAAVVLLIVNGIVDHHKKPQADDGKQQTGTVDPVGKDDPENPDHPDTPDTPDNPDNPDHPDTPDTPDTPDEPEGYAVIELVGEQHQYDAVYRVGDTGFEMYTYVSGPAERYTGAVNKLAEKLQGTAKVYAVTVPLSSGVTIPDQLLGTTLFDDQKAAEEKITAMFSDQVTDVPLYDALMRHRTEYIYYRTDHHWTGLGAYYGYRAFCQAKEITPHELADFRTEDYTGFLGSFYNDSGKSAELAANPDTVTAYFPIADPPMTIIDQGGNTMTCPSVICDESNAPAGYKYGAYIYGDNKYTYIENPDIADNSACVVIKESFGNAMVPFLVNHYHTVYVLDYRYWSGDLGAFVRENGVQDVVFINNLSAIRSSYLMGKLQEMVG